jgi:hypothetical protein
MDEHPGVDLRPPIERVPARRAAPLVVVLAVLGALVLFVTRPWDGPSPPPPVAPATATTSPATIIVVETTAPSLTPTALTPNVRCAYGRARNGARRLVRLEVQPPIATLDQSASPISISRVAWRFEAETNVQQGVFDRDWQYVRASGVQAAGTADGTGPSFTPLQIPIRPNDVTDNSVFRVRLVVEWFTGNPEPAGSAEIVTNRYEVGGQPRSDSQFQPYCAGTLTTN